MSILFSKEPRSSRKRPPATDGLISSSGFETVSPDADCVSEVKVHPSIYSLPVGLDRKSGTWSASFIAYSLELVSARGLISFSGFETVGADAGSVSERPVRPSPCAMWIVCEVKSGMLSASLFE